MSTSNFVCTIYCEPGNTDEAERTCRRKKGEHCRYCGWEKSERERRKSIPLVKGKDGLERKYVDIPKPCRGKDVYEILGADISDTEDFTSAANDE